jgi:hypothetical protein
MIGKLLLTCRPSFEELFHVFSDNPEYVNLRELLLLQDLQQLGM